VTRARLAPDAATRRHIVHLCAKWPPPPEWQSWKEGDITARTSIMEPHATMGPPRNKKVHINIININNNNNSSSNNSAPKQKDEVMQQETTKQEQQEEGKGIYAWNGGRQSTPQPTRHVLEDVHHNTKASPSKARRVGTRKGRWGGRKTQQLHQRKHQLGLPLCPGDGTHSPEWLGRRKQPTQEDVGSGSAAMCVLHAARRRGVCECTTTRTHPHTHTPKQGRRKIARMKGNTRPGAHCSHRVTAVHGVGRRV